MALKLTFILADISFFCLMVYDMRHLDAKRPLEQFFKVILQSFATTVLAVITTVFLFNVMTTAKTKEEFKKIDATNVTNPRSQGCPRFQSGEELANSVGKINAYYSL